MLKPKNCKIDQDANDQFYNYVSPLKVANFNLNIKYPAFTSRRYSQQQKIMSRRQMVSSPFSFHKKDEISNGSIKKVVKQIKESPEAEGAAEFKCFTPVADAFSPFFRDRILELRAFLYKKRHQNKPQKQQHINFSQLAILQQIPKVASVLQAQTIRKCPFSRPSQAKMATSPAKLMKRPNTSTDAFKSIQVNSNGKYGSTSKIDLREPNYQNKEISRLKNKLEKQLIERSHTQRRSSRPSTFRKSVKDRQENDCRPWQIKKGEQEHFQLEY